MGTYLNQIFPFMGIRFIALNDHYDSKEHQGNIIEMDTAFQTLLYDLYSKDVVPTIMQIRNPGKVPGDGKVRTWSVAAVRNILNNRFYLGEMAYGKSVRKSVGSKSKKIYQKKSGR